jgi:hypothetical protein
MGTKEQQKLFQFTQNKNGQGCSVRLSCQTNKSGGSQNLQRAHHMQGSKAQ